MAEFDPHKPLKNAKHERFCQAMAAGKMTNTDAYLDAGYACNSAAAAVGASKLLKQAKIAARIEAIKQAILTVVVEQSAVTPARIVSELAKLAFSDIRRLVEFRSELTQTSDNADGGDVLIVQNLYNTRVNFVPSDLLDDDTAAAISEVSQGKDGQLRVKMHAKQPALALLADIFGMTAKKVADPEPPAKPEDMSLLEAARMIAFALTQAKRLKASTPESA